MSCHLRKKYGLPWSVVSHERLVETEEGEEVGRERRSHRTHDDGVVDDMAQHGDDK